MLKCLVPFCILLLAPSLVQADDVKKQSAKTPTLVVRLTSLDTLFDRLNLLGGLIGQEGLGKKIDESIKAKLGPKGLYGVDGTRSIGLYANVGADLSDFSGVLMVPVSDAGQFKDMLKSLGWEVSSDPGGLCTVKQDLIPVDVQYRIANGYAYVGLLGQDMLSPAALLAPEAVFGKSPSPSVLAVTLQLSQVPEGLRGIFIDFLKEQLLPDGETNKDTKSPVPAILAKEITRILDQVLKDGEKLDATIDIEPKTKQLTVELALTARPKSKLEGEIARLSQPLQFEVDLGSVVGVKNDGARQTNEEAQQSSSSDVNSVMNVRLEGGQMLRVRLTMGLSALKLFQLGQDK
jgi:hypothetical protein